MATIQRLTEVVNELRRHGEVTVIPRSGEVIFGVTKDGKSHRLVFSEGQLADSTGTVTSLINRHFAHSTVDDSQPLGG